MNEFNNYEMDALSGVSMAELNAALAASNMEEQVAMPVPVELTCNWEEVRKFVAAMIPKGNLFEIRSLPKSGDPSWRVCVMNTPEGLDAAFSGLAAKGLDKSPLYMTLQAVQQDAQCLHNYGKVIPNKSCVKDADIDHYQWLYIDTDPNHPSGTQATDEEMSHAEAVAEQVMKYLSGKGFPKPVYAFTGNGRAIYYKIDMTADTEHKQLISRFLKALSKKYSTVDAEIDTSVCNPARITKLIGCPSCKGENTPERPYRMSELLSVPNEVGEVSAEQFQAVIDELAPKKESKKAIKAREAAEQQKTAMILDVKAWLDSYDLVYRESEFENDGKTVYKYELEDCPFAEHDNSYCSAVFWESSGKTAFHCFHNSCSGHTIHDMLAKYPLIEQLPLILGENDKIKIYNSVASEISLILSNDNRKYVLNNKTKEVLAFDGMDFDNLIIQKAQQQGLIISNTAVTTLKGNFRSNYGKYSIRRPVSRRIAYRDKKLYYAISRENIISISTEKIEKYNGEDVLFYYGENYVDQTVPDLTSAASALPDLVKQCFNISDEYLLCFLAHLCTLYMPNVNSPILLLSGGQGTSKSTTAKKIKSLVDPTHTDVMSMPEKESDLYASLSSGYLVAYDNIAEISNSFSDILCIAVTGGVATKRRLFTDNDLVEVSLHTNVILNGIDNDIVKKTDLAERCNTIYLERIRHRLTDKQVWKAFEVIKPKLLGSILNTIKIGLSYVDEMIDTIDELPRMADFAVYGAAMIKAMGQNYNEFLSQYMHSTNEMLSDRAELDDFVVLIKRFLNSNSGYWCSGAEELLKELQAFAESKRLYIGKFTSNTLSRKLNSMDTSLTAAGISFERGRGSDRYIKLTKEVEKLSSPTLEELLADD